MAKKTIVYLTETLYGYIDRGTLILKAGNRNVRISNAPFKFLSSLIRQPDRIVSYPVLFEDVYSEQYYNLSDATLLAAIKARLIKELKGYGIKNYSFISCVKGLGYRLEPYKIVKAEDDYVSDYNEDELKDCIPEIIKKFNEIWHLLNKVNTHEELLNKADFFEEINAIENEFTYETRRIAEIEHCHSH